MMNEAGHILVVDDHRTNRLKLTLSLKQQGHTTAEAESGRQALEMLRAGAFDLVLLDILMPEMDGYEVLAQMKQEVGLRDVPVIVISAQDELESVVRGIELGADDYLPKAFNPTLLKARISACLEKKRLHDQEVRQQADLRAAHQEVQEKNAQLQELNASKDKFFSIIAHDLRSPLTAVLGYAEQFEKFLTEHPVAGDLLETSEKLHGAAKSLHALLENLLTWARIQRGAMKYQPSLSRLHDLLEETLILFEPVAERKGLTLRSTVTDDITIYADEIMMKTVVRNLVSNALKFTATGSVTISASRQGNLIEIAVADTGRGMDAEGLAKLFRLDAHYTNVGTDGEKGTGLGLLLCQDLVEQNRGTLRVASEVGRGTTFRMTLPAAQP